MNSPSKSATIPVTDFLFLHHFFKHLLSQTRVQSMKKGLRRKCTAPQKLDTKLLGCFL